MRLLLLVGALALVGCGSGSGTCHTPHGTYLEHYSEVSGTCGVGSGSLLTDLDAASADPVCSGKLTMDASCRVTGARDCVSADGTRETVISSALWQSDDYGSSTVSISLMLVNGSSCTSIIEYTYTRP